MLFVLARDPVGRIQHHRIIDSALFERLAELVNLRHVFSKSYVIILKIISTRCSPICVSIDPDLAANFFQRRRDEEWTHIDSGRLAKTLDESFVNRNNEKERVGAIIKTTPHTRAH